NCLHRDPGAGIELKDAVELLGPEVLIPQHVRREAARFAQLLGCGEITVRLLEFPLGAFGVIDVGLKAIPIYNSVPVGAEWEAPHTHPAVAAAGPALPGLEIVGLIRGQ